MNASISISIWALRPGALSMLDVIEHRFEAALNAVFIRYSPDV